jgi:hypothetical protein
VIYSEAARLRDETLTLGTGGTPKANIGAMVAGFPADPRVEVRSVIHLTGGFLLGSAPVVSYLEVPEGHAVTLFKHRGLSPPNSQ